MSETQITKIVTRLATRPKWSIEARRNKVSQMIAEEIQRSDELNQALMELDILLDKLQKVYQEVDDVCEHLLKHYLKSETSSSLCTNSALLSFIILVLRKDGLCICIYSDLR